MWQDETLLHSGSFRNRIFHQEIMNKEQLARFGSVCADSLVYQSLSDTLILHDRTSDIERLFDNGKAVVGNVLGSTSNVIVYLKKHDGISVFKATANGIVVWMSQNSEDIEELAWTYIDLLSGLKVSINNSKIFNYGNSK